MIGVVRQFGPERGPGGLEENEAPQVRGPLAYYTSKYHLYREQLASDPL